MNPRVLRNSIFNSRRSIIWILSFECAHCFVYNTNDFPARPVVVVLWDNLKQQKKCLRWGESQCCVTNIYISRFFVVPAITQGVFNAYIQVTYNTRRVFCLQPHTGRIKWCLSLGNNAIWSMHEREMDTDRQGPSTRDGFVLVLCPHRQPLPPRFLVVYAAETDAIGTLPQ